LKPIVLNFGERLNATEAVYANSPLPDPIFMHLLSSDEMRRTDASNTRANFTVEWREKVDKVQAKN
jgi:hypothetical protein